MDFNLTSLVRTLATRNDLALQVQYLMIKAPPGRAEHPRQHRDISSEDLDLFNNMFEMNFKPTNGDSISISRDSSQQPWEKGQVRPQDEGHCEQDKGLFYQHPKSALAVLLLAQVPNILRFSMDSESLLPFSICQPGSLPRLAEFHVSLPSNEDSLADIQNVLAAAPALGRLKARLGYMTSNKVFHGNLTTLSLHSCDFTADAFRSLLNGSKRLECLSYENPQRSNVQQAMLPELLDAILLRADTLRSLILWFNTRDGHQSIDVSMMENLKDMRTLEKLDITLDGGYHPAHLRLDNILPRSIRTFSNMYPAFCSPYQEKTRAIIALAKSVPGKFPNLKQVLFCLCEDEASDEKEVKHNRRKIRAAFAKRGIVCLLE
ncbi:hypothetical protein FDECE_6584 [Fusarium decemcellulare]|nr:hypothetical protein FDECE_6584 [Fusarium decemcellulare]